MKKKIIAMLLVAALALTAIGCGAAAPAPAATPAPAPAETAAPAAAVGMANPVQQTADFMSLLSAQPGIKLNNAVTGASNVMYSWINNLPPISQITFTLGGVNYTYRAAAAQGGIATTDISGVYTQFPSTTSMEVNTENTAGGTYVLRYDSSSGEGVATWASALSGCQYSLYTDKGCAGSMPLVDVMNSLYTCTAGAQSVSGTVLAAQTGTLTVYLDDGSTVVFETNSIKYLNVNIGDTVVVTYQGSLDGSSQALQITRTGTARTDTFTGVMYMMTAPDMMLYTRDNNVYVFTITTETPVTGLLDNLDDMTAGNEVRVTYTGKLDDEPLVTNIEVLKIKADPTPTPTPAQEYTTRTSSGYVTGLAGDVANAMVTVNGVCFRMDATAGYVYGTPDVGVWAEITYRDYGTGTKNYKVVKAVFNNDPYPTYNTVGTVTACSQDGHNYTICVNGMWFSFNTRGIEGSGTPSVGAWANINYKDYGGGNYEVTNAVFTGQVEPQYYIDYAYGQVDSYNGRTITLTSGDTFYIASDCTIYGEIVPGWDVSIDYRVILQSHTTYEAFSITSYYDPAPVPVPDPTVYVSGIVSDVQETGASWSITVDGGQYHVDATNPHDGAPYVGCWCQLQIVNGDVVYAQFS